MEKNKQFKNELLMETLRAKSSKSFLELAKNTRLSLLERRYNIDGVEKLVLQTALDNLQNNILIKNRSNLVERLESLTRRSFLKFTDNANTNSLFISSDMFYLEILLDPQSGKVNDVKVHHECSNESESEPSLIEVLRKGDFIDFTMQLEGFQSIYQLNAESKIKSKAFIAIQALETDLQNIFEMESLQKVAPEVLLISSSVGIVTPRKGGHSMRLTFFVRPAELLNIELKRSESLTNAMEAAMAAKTTIGNSGIINLEAAAPSNKLQIAPLLIKNGNGDLTYSPINVHNSAMLPAAFVLRLNKGIPLAMQFLDEIKKITNLENFDTQNEAPTPLIELIISQESQGTYENGKKGLFVNLPDQSQCFFISENQLQGKTVKNIRFTEAKQITKILALLRNQAIFNALIASCVRMKHENIHEDCESYMFEVTVVSMQFLQIFVEHPTMQSIVTVELYLNDVKQIKCRINGSDQQFDSKLENYINRVFQKTMSIPLVLRSLIKFWENEAEESQMLHQKRLFNRGLNGGMSDTKSRGDDEKDNVDKGDLESSLEESFTGNRNSFEICGINKNEIFFKANEQKNATERQNDGNIFKVFDQLSHKMARDIKFDMGKVTDDVMLHGRASISDDLVSGIKTIFPMKAGFNVQKSLDVFDFNDPSPPPGDATKVPVLPPFLEDRSRKVPTPRASPIASSSSFNLERRLHDSEILKTQTTVDMPKASLISTTPLTNTPVNFNYEKPKSEKKKKRKREDGDGGSPSIVKKKSSLTTSSSPLKKSFGSSSLLGKPSTSFKSKKSPNSAIETMDDLSFLNFGVDQQIIQTPLSSPQSLFKGIGSSSQTNRKNSLSAVINKLKSVNDAMVAPDNENKRSEYQIKSSGSDGIKITFNKTKSFKSKSPKHTGLKPGVNSGPASKKSSQPSKSSSHKLLYQKSSSSGSLTSVNSTCPSPKSSSQPVKSFSKETSFSGFTGNSNEMLKNMLSIASQGPRTDVVKAFDKKFQIPKLSARGKSDEKPSFDEDFHSTRSAPSTPAQSPTMDFMRESSSNQLQMSQQTFCQMSNLQQQNKFLDRQQQSKKLYKSSSSEELYAEMADKLRKSNDLNDTGYQSFFRTQQQISASSVQISEGQQVPNSVDDIMSFIGNEM